MRAEAKIRRIENRFWLVCRLIAVAMRQKGAEVWAKHPDLQPAHGWSDSLLTPIDIIEAFDVVFTQHLTGLDLDDFEDRIAGIG